MFRRYCYEMNIIEKIENCWNRYGSTMFEHVHSVSVCLFAVVWYHQVWARWGSEMSTASPSRPARPPPPSAAARRRSTDIEGASSVSGAAVVPSYFDGIANSMSTITICCVFIFLLDLSPLWSPPGYHYFNVKKIASPIHRIFAAGLHSLACIITLMFGVLKRVSLVRFLYSFVCKWYNLVHFYA